MAKLWGDPSWNPMERFQEAEVGATAQPEYDSWL